MQIIRLVQTLLILLNRKKIAAKELAERFEVSTRTIYRDVDALSLAGIPVYSVKGNGGGIYLDADFHVNNTLFEEEEQNELFLALNLLKSVGLADTEKLLTKLGAIYDWSNWLEIDFSQTKETTSSDFLLIKRAIFEQRQIHFTYYTIYGQTQVRCLLPVKIIFKNRTWYVSGYNHNEEKWENLSLRQIKQIKIDKNKAEQPLPLKHEKLAFDSIPVDFRFSKRISYKQYAEFSELTCRINADSSYEATVYFSDIEDIYSFVLPLGKNVELLAPEWIKEKVLQHVKAFYDKNF